MDTKLTPVEMFNELVRMGCITPAPVEPSGYMAPTAYISVPTVLASGTPAIPTPETKGAANAKLGSRLKGNRKRKARARR